MEIGIYDISGRQITYFSSLLALAGSQNMRWNAQNHPAGVYYIVLKTGNRSIIRRVMHIK